jgi:hypothetical protein
MPQQLEHANNFNDKSPVTFNMIDSSIFFIKKNQYKASFIIVMPPLKIRRGDLYNQRSMMAYLNPLNSPSVSSSNDLAHSVSFQMLA